ncbi:heavy-metal-associated domain-containing protein [Halobacterium jilantaiense]|uniref:heavy-metal-associated domain-containing protein n=1 Tax=Halobacterium jilantaiense TaxID=355548 RepID=UPI00115FA9B2|nr:heavy-metal-associated domain-containing protein [Halobacterium jilantaiense]
MATSRATFTVTDARSPADVENIEDALRDHEGVQLVDIDPETGETEVRHGESLVSGEEIRSAVEELGYDVEPDEEP